MANTVYTWAVVAMEVHTQADGHSNVVFTVHWTCSGVWADTTGSCYGSCGVPAPTGAFTPYSDLTQDQVLNWIWAASVDKDAIEANITAQIREKIAPEVQTPPLPWAA